MAEKDIAQKLKQLCKKTTNDGQFDKTYIGIITGIYPQENNIKIKYNNKEKLFKVSDIIHYHINDCVKIFVPNNNDLNAYIDNPYNKRIKYYLNHATVILEDNTEYLLSGEGTIIPNTIDLSKFTTAGCTSILWCSNSDTAASPLYFVNGDSSKMVYVSGDSYTQVTAIPGSSFVKLEINNISNDGQIIICEKTVFSQNII